MSLAFSIHCFLDNAQADVTSINMVGLHDNEAGSPQGANSTMDPLDHGGEPRNGRRQEVAAKGLDEPLERARRYN